MYRIEPPYIDRPLVSPAIRLQNPDSKPIPCPKDRWSTNGDLRSSAQGVKNAKKDVSRSSPQGSRIMRGNDHNQAHVWRLVLTCPPSSSSPSRPSLQPSSPLERPAWGQGPRPRRHHRTGRPPASTPQGEYRDSRSSVSLS